MWVDWSVQQENMAPGYKERYGYCTSKHQSAAR